MKTSIERIAKEILKLETLESRNSDDKDFREHAVWNIKVALSAAYVAGYEAASKTFLKEAAKGWRV